MERSREIEASQRALKLERLFDAPRKVVFQAWIDPRELAQWWGPKGFTNPVCEVDPRVGGAIRIVMRGPNGFEHEMKGVFQEIVTNEKIVFTNTAIAPNGSLLLSGETTVRFSEHGGKTRIVLETRATAMTPEAAEMLTGMNLGWNQSLERLTLLVDG